MTDEATDDETMRLGRARHGFYRAMLDRLLVTCEDAIEYLDEGQGPEGQRALDHLTAILQRTVALVDQSKGNSAEAIEVSTAALMRLTATVRSEIRERKAQAAAQAGVH